MRKFALVICITALLMSSSNAQDCYESTIDKPTPFMGNNGEIFKLSDGSLWEVKYEYEYLYEYNPSVTICPSQGKLIVNGTSLYVELLTSYVELLTSSTWEIYEETYLEGLVDGLVKQGRIFKTTSGNIFEVTGLTLQLVLELEPGVIILRNGDKFKLIVDGFDEPLICEKLK